MPRNQPTITIIGAGRVGLALGKLLRERGWRIGAVVTRSKKTARAAVRAIGAGNAKSRVDGQVFDADVVLITTPDREIADIAKTIAVIAGEIASGPPDKSGGRPELQHRRKSLSRTTVLHTNGALDRSVLAPLEKMGASTGSLHPLQTFSNRAVPNLKGRICAIEGTPPALRIGRRICRELGCVPVVIAPRSKPAYHAAAALAAGHILAVIEAATRILVGIGFSHGDAVRALLPLTRQTLDNFDKFGASVAWTGPLARGDFETVKKHTAALRRFPREYRDAYEAIARLALLVLGKGRRK